MHYIYAIQHNVTKKIYVGCSRNVQNRYVTHIQLLRRGNHSSKEMQEDFKQFGEDYSVFILEKLENENEKVRLPEFNNELLTRKTISEVKWMREYDTIKNGYNAQDLLARRVLGERKPKIIAPIKEGKPAKD